MYDRLDILIFISSVFLVSCVANAENSHISDLKLSLLWNAFWVCAQHVIFRKQTWRPPYDMSMTLFGWNFVYEIEICHKFGRFLAFWLIYILAVDRQYVWFTKSKGFHFIYGRRRWNIRQPKSTTETVLLAGMEAVVSATTQHLQYHADANSRLCHLLTDDARSWPIGAGQRPV